MSHSPICYQLTNQRVRCNLFDPNQDVVLAENEHRLRLFPKVPDHLPEPNTPLTHGPEA